MSKFCIAKALSNDHLRKCYIFTGFPLQWKHCDSPSRLLWRKTYLWCHIFITWDNALSMVVICRNVKS